MSRDNYWGRRIAAYVAFGIAVATSGCMTLRPQRLVDGPEGTKAVRYLPIHVQHPYGEPGESFLDKNLGKAPVPNQGNTPIPESHSPEKDIADVVNAPAPVPKAPEPQENAPDPEGPLQD